MALKLPILFSIFLIIPISSVYAYTDEQLTMMYRGQDDNATLNNIDKALRSGALRCSDLPSNLNFGYCASSKPTIVDSNAPAKPSPFSFWWTLPLPIILWLIISLVRRMFSRNDDEYENAKVTQKNSSGTLPKDFESTVERKKIKMNLFHRILLTIGLIKVKKNA